MNRIAVFVPVFFGLANLAWSQPAPTLTFLGRAYRLGSFNQKFNATWERDSQQLDDSDHDYRPY